MTGVSVRDAMAAIAAATGNISNAAATVAVFGEILGWWDLL